MVSHLNKFSLEIFTLNIVSEIWCLFNNEKHVGTQSCDTLLVHLNITNYPVQLNSVWQIRIKGSRLPLKLPNNLYLT